MQILQSYINELRNLDLGLEKFIDKQILAHKGEILAMIKLRLFNVGEDGDGNKLQDYTPETVLIKKSKGQRSSHTTLRDTGDFYNDMFINANNGNIFISSRNEKTNLLEDKYGRAIFKLTDDEQQKIIDTIIEPQLDNYLNVNDIQIELNLD